MQLLEVISFVFGFLCLREEDEVLKIKAFLAAEFKCLRERSDALRPDISNPTNHHPKERGRFQSSFFGKHRPRNPRVLRLLPSQPLHEERAVISVRKHGWSRCT